MYVSFSDSLIIYLKNIENYFRSGALINIYPLTGKCFSDFQNRFKVRRTSFVLLLSGYGISIDRFEHNSQHFYFTYSSK